MFLFVTGINHKRAPVQVREKLALTESVTAESVSRLLAGTAVQEAVILSTCNRFEVYGAIPTHEETNDFLRPFFVELLGVEDDSFRQHFYHLTGKEAVEHLLEVASSLDSMVIGETQIIGQVRDAYKAAEERNATGKHLNRLFQKAFEIGKRVHAETPIGRNAVSVSYAAVELARKIFSKLEGRSAMVIGVGEMSRLTLENLAAQGVKRTFVTNRNFQNAVNLASRFDGEAVEFDAFPERLAEIDILISSTAAPGYILDAAAVEQAMVRRKQEPMLLIDIAVPRDLDPAIGNIANAYLYNIDDLQAVVDRNYKERQAAAEQARIIVAEGTEQYLGWLDSLEAVPIIEGLMKRADRIAQEELAKLNGKLEGLSELEKQAVKAAIRAATNKLMHAPLANLKRLAQERRSPDTLDLVRDLFELRE